MPGELEGLAPVDIRAVLIAALLNPAVILVALFLGCRADQWQKLPIAAFAAAALGSVLFHLAVGWRVPGTAGLGRAAAGVFLAEFVFALLWALAGYAYQRRRRP